MRNNRFAKKLISIAVAVSLFMELPALFPMTAQNVLAEGSSATELPSWLTGEPSQPAESAAAIEDPTTVNADPAAGNTNPTAGNTDPIAGNADPTAGNTDPAAAAPPAESLEITFEYTSSTGMTEEMTMTYSDDLFAQSSYLYNPALASASMALTMSSGNAVNYLEGGKNACQLLVKMGFGNVYYNYDYHTSTHANTTGVAIGSKKLSDGTTLIAVIPRSANYEKEWAGNFNVGDTGTEHEGFKIGSENVLRELKNYLTKGKGQRISGEVKIWIAGYSRGSAITNLTAARLDEGYELSSAIEWGPEDVYAYCFEVPASTTSEAAHDSLYSNIFCFINPIDLVPMVPLAQWGFTRYGTTLYFPQAGDGVYETYYPDVLDLLHESYPLKDATQLANQRILLQIILQAVSEKIYSRSMYVNTVQTPIMTALETGTISDPLETALDIYFDILLGQFDITRVPAAIAHLVKNGEIEPTYIDLESSLIDDIKNLLSDTKLVFTAHYGELTYAWVRTLEGTGVLEQQLPAEQVMGEPTIPIMDETALSDGTYDIILYRDKLLPTGSDLLTEEGVPVGSSSPASNGLLAEVDLSKPYTITDDAVENLAIGDVITFPDYSFTVSSFDMYEDGDYRAIAFNGGSESCFYAGDGLWRFDWLHDDLALTYPVGTVTLLITDSTDLFDYRTTNGTGENVYGVTYSEAFPDGGYDPEADYFRLESLTDYFDQYGEYMTFEYAVMTVTDGKVTRIEIPYRP